MRSIFAILLILLTRSGAVAADPKPIQLIGYTEGRNDLPNGQYANWVTNRACTVRADGTGWRVLAEELTKKPHSWTQFAGWSPDGITRNGLSTLV
jgi:TolB protein